MIAASAPLDDAAAFLEKEDYAAARDIWQPLAEQGNAAAQTRLGILYENGWSVPKNATKADELYQRAADQDEPEAESRLGERYITGSDLGQPFPHDVSKGIALLEKAASHGNPYYMVTLGTFLQDGRWGVQQDEKRAVENFRKAADLGDSRGESRLGLAYETGRGVEKDSAEAKKWYDKAAQHDLEAAQAGDLLAQMRVASGFELGVAGYKYDLGAALAWYQKAERQPGRLRQNIEMHIAHLERRINRTE